MENTNLPQNTLQPIKEEWSKPEVLVTSINDDTLCNGGTGGDYNGEFSGPS